MRYSKVVEIARNLLPNTAIRFANEDKPFWVYNDGDRLHITKNMKIEWDQLETQYVHQGQRQKARDRFNEITPYIPSPTIWFNV